MENTDETKQYIKQMFAHWNDAAQQEPPLVLTFGKFAEGDYPDGEHNLYIVWRGKQTHTKPQRKPIV